MLIAKLGSLINNRHDTQKHPCATHILFIFTYSLKSCGKLNEIIPISSEVDINVCNHNFSISCKWQYEAIACCQSRNLKSYVENNRDLRKKIQSTYMLMGRVSETLHYERGNYKNSIGHEACNSKRGANTSQSIIWNENRKI